MEIKDRGGKVMTKEEVIRATVDMLGNLAVPIALENVSGTVQAARNNLLIVLQAMEAEKAPQLELVPKDAAEAPKKTEEAGE